MFRVALTGGIGSGKSEAGDIFESLGAVVVDSDQLSRDVIERGTPGFDEVIENFGDAILTDGAIDRKKLGELVFNDSQKRQVLEKIIHPRVRAAFNEVVASAGENAIIINQIPLLVETEGSKNFDSVITVSTPIEIRKERLIKRGLKGYEIENRMAAQVSDKEREAIAEFIIDNSGNEAQLQSQVENIYEELKLRASSN
jgi:dephospho-CoA kinase